MAAGPALYSPQMLRLAIVLADYPLRPGLHWRGSARSPLCGSQVTVGLECDAAGRIGAVGLSVSACAVGQAAAAIFAQAARGTHRAEIATADVALAQWLADEAAPIPDWPGLEVLAAARAYPARHAAIRLGWHAALAALDAPALHSAAAAI